MHLVHHLVSRHLGQGRAQRVCYLDTELGEVTYAGLYEALRWYAGALRARGVPPGTRGVVVADDSVATVAAILGLWWHGCTPVPVHHMLTAPEISFIVRDSAAHFLHLDAPGKTQLALGAQFAELPQLTGEEVRQALRNAVPALEAGEPVSLPPDAEVLVQYTSGSTGTLKGVRHGRRGISAVFEGFGSVLALTPEDLVLSTAKLSFGYGFGNSLLFPLAAGAGAILLRGAVDGYILATALRQHRPSVVFSVPRVYSALLDQDAAQQGRCSLSAARLCVSAGEHLPAELGERFTKTVGIPLLNGLGATEVLHIVVASRPGDTTPGSLGFPVPGVAVTVRDDDGLVLPDGAPGRLHVAAASVMLGYLNRRACTARALADGGVYTGDIVQRSAEGRIQYLCRVDDLLNLGGCKVSPREIETVVRTAVGVADCAVVGSIDSHGLEQAIVYAVPSAGVSADELRRAIIRSLREHLAPFKRPARVEVLDALPVTPTGKVAYVTLRSTAEQR